MKAINLRTEYLVNPIGIGIRRPRLMWTCEGGTAQTAYQIVAEKWDSGKVAGASMHADYPAELSDRERVNWKIRLWDEHGQPGEWSEAFFEIGISDWKARWITGNYSPKKNRRYPVDCFRKTFTSGKAVTARLYISACGEYEARINGKRVGNFVLAPGSTDYHKRIQYQTYDVTELIRDGENALTVELADGWYRGSSGARGRTCTYGTVTRLIAQLEILDQAGNMQAVITDGSWQWSSDGPIRFADNEYGEIVDAEETPSYSGKAKVTSFQVPLTASDNVFVTEHEHYRPVEKILTPSGKTVLKFPQNLCGYLSFRLNARKGQTIRIRLGEMLDDAGEFTQKNIQCVTGGKASPLQEFTYTCREGQNEYKPKFFYGGFQYALVETDIPFELNDFAQIALYSDFPFTSSFSCSNPLLNRFYKATEWSLKSNSTDLPSDCPTRERMGWTGDSQVFFGTASYLADYAAFARKHLRDVFDRQWKNGKLPQIAPYANEDWFMHVMNGSVGWADVGILMPWRFWQKYGDRRILEDNFDNMLRYAKFMISRCGKWGGVWSRPLGISRANRKYAVNAGQSYGEWAEPKDVKAFVWTDFAVTHPEESTAYTAWVLGIMADICEILGKHDPVPMLREYADGAKRAYQEMVSTEKFSLDTDRQAKLVRTLYMNLLSEEQTAFAKKRLIQALENYGWRLGTGFLSTPLILYVLADMDIEYAYRLLENEEIPGWLSMPKSGAVTIWEGWEGSKSDSGICSLNHYSKGAVCEWLFDTCCGIRVDGENHFRIVPRPGGYLTHAEAAYDSVYGRIESGWEKKNGRTSFTVTVPANCTAAVSLPDGSEHVQEPGTRVYTV
ncbi:MAG: family 78 glycoside hydrolase catalytic domain [Lentisphaeria bacterium]|nr:family 78 glycoside hydrolase catalytic domain [Lentisphaeria bacterium]